MELAEEMERADAAKARIARTVLIIVRLLCLECTC
jgi:hypothetical protein